MEDGRAKVEEKMFWKSPVLAPTPEPADEPTDCVSVRSEILLNARRSRLKSRGSLVAVVYDCALEPELDTADDSWVMSSSMRFRTSSTSAASSKDRSLSSSYESSDWLRES